MFLVVGFGLGGHRVGECDALRKGFSPSITLKISVNLTRLSTKDLRHSPPQFEYTCRLRDYNSLEYGRRSFQNWEVY
jgi:hypothetical protein